MTYRLHHRRWIVVVAVVALALAGCSVRGTSSGQTPPTEPTPWHYQTLSPTAKPDPSLTATSLAESLVAFEGLAAFRAYVQATGDHKPVWDFGYVGITSDHLDLSIEFWATHACQVQGDLRHLYGFVDPNGSYLHQFAAWSRDGLCVSMGYSTQTVEPQAGPQRSHSMHVTLFDRAGLARYWFYDKPVTFRFVEAGSAQCPACQYHHWVLSS